RMAGQHLPQRYQPGSVSRREGAALSPYQGGDRDVHAPGALHLKPTTTGIEEGWALLNAKVRERVLTRAGRVVEKRAYEEVDGRICAVVLGERGLVTVEPTVNDTGGLASSVQLLAARPGSVRSVQVAADTTTERYATAGSAHHIAGSPRAPAIAAQL